MQQLYPAPRSPLASDALAGRRAVVTGASRGIGLLDLGMTGVPTHRPERWAADAPVAA